MPYLKDVFLEQIDFMRDGFANGGVNSRNWLRKEHPTLAAFAKSLFLFVVLGVGMVGLMLLADWNQTPLVLAILVLPVACIWVFFMISVWIRFLEAYDMEKREKERRKIDAIRHDGP